MLDWIQANKIGGQLSGDSSLYNWVSILWLTSLMLFLGKTMSLIFKLLKQEIWCQKGHKISFVSILLSALNVQRRVCCFFTKRCLSQGFSDVAKVYLARKQYDQIGRNFATLCKTLSLWLFFASLFSTWQILNLFWSFSMLLANLIVDNGQI